MAFGFNNASGGGGNQEVQAMAGPELEEIQPESIGFLAVNRDNKIRLLKSPWPSDAPASPTASLLSIASRSSLVAAVGPDALVIANTESLRKSLETSTQSGAVIDVEPMATIPLPMRISHVCFTSDEKYLVITAETGGGLAAYEVSSLAQGNPPVAFQISTNGISVRSLAPNPAIGQYIALVLTNGSLLLADLESRNLLNGSNGPVLRENVSCASWSVKGKQLIAGLGDGTVQQLKPTGDLVATIPYPPTAVGNQHVSSLYWLANEDFLIVHTPNPSTDGDAMESTEPPVYHHVRREKGTQNYMFLKFISDPAPLGWERPEISPHQMILRLRDFQPNLADLLLVTSNRSSNIGMLANATMPLIDSHPVVNTYTTLDPADEGRKAAMPFSDRETWPVGAALDLTATENVLRPIPSNLEYAESPTPLPALAILNNEGHLIMWWIVNDESIKKGTGYQGLVKFSGEQQPSAQTPQAAQSTQAATPAQSSPFSNPGAGSAQPSFGFAKPAFGASTQPAAFGTPSTFGQKSVWGGSPAAATPTPAFGQPSAFGAAKPAGSGAAFGSTGGLGRVASPWASAQQASDKPAQATTGPAASSGGSGFSGFANSGGFASIAQKPAQSAFASSSQSGSGFSFGQAKPGVSSFGTPSSSFGLKTEPSFGSTLSLDSSKGDNSGSGKLSSPWVNASISSFGTPGQQQSTFSNVQSSFTSVSNETDMGDAEERDNRDRSEATPTPQDRPQEKPSGLFGTGNSGFKLGSSFTGDGTAKDDAPKPAAGSSLFGSDFGKALDNRDNAPVTPIKQEPEDTEVNVNDVKEKPATNLFSTPSGAAPSQPVESTPAGPNQNSGTFSSPKAHSRPSQSADSPSTGNTGPTTLTPAQKPQPVQQKSSVPEDAPLPPDFTTPAATKPAEEELPPLAGSPPITVEAPSSEPTSSPLNGPQDDEFEIEETEDSVHGEASELEGVGQKSPVRRTSRPQPPSNNWSFQSSTQSNIAPPPAPSPPNKSRSPSRSPARSPLRNQAYPTTTPAGFPKGPVFAPPLRGPDSPRSPSPIRSASTPSLGGRAAVPPAKPVPRPVSRAKAPTPPAPEPLVEDLSDDEDERIRVELEAPIVPATKLEGFVTQIRPEQEPSTVKPGIPGQIERVYRDINGMIDTLGINARSLAAFIAGHSERAGRRKDHQDLEDVIFNEDSEDWHLVEIQDLSYLEDDIQDNLDDGRVTDVFDKLTSLSDLHRNLTRLRTRAKALERQLRRDADSPSSTTHAPLSTEQSYQQRTLRKSFADLQSRLREAEDAVVLLRTRLATSSPSSSTQQKNAAPTVEAVTNTILKMTGMIERKSGDIDVLETQLRKLRVASAEPPSSSASKPRSREGTYSLDFSDSDDDEENEGAVVVKQELETPTKRMPGAFQTPQSIRRAGSEAPSSGRTLGVYHTPGSSFESPAAARLRAGAGDAGVSEEEAKAKAERLRKRKGLAKRFEEALVKKGSSVTNVAS